MCQTFCWETHIPSYPWLLLLPHIFLRRRVCWNLQITCEETEVQRRPSCLKERHLGHGRAAAIQTQIRLNLEAPFWVTLFASLIVLPLYVCVCLYVSLQAYTYHVSAAGLGQQETQSWSGCHPCLYGPAAWWGDRQTQNNPQIQLSMIDATGQFLVLGDLG